MCSPFSGIKAHLPGGQARKKFLGRKGISGSSRWKAGRGQTPPHWVGSPSPAFSFFRPSASFSGGARNAGQPGPPWGLKPGVPPPPPQPFFSGLFPALGFFQGLVCWLIPMESTKHRFFPTPGPEFPPFPPGFGGPTPTQTSFFPSFFTCSSAPKFFFFPVHSSFLSHRCFCPPPEFFLPP